MTINISLDVLLNPRRLILASVEEDLDGSCTALPYVLVKMKSSRHLVGRQNVREEDTESSSVFNCLCTALALVYTVNLD